MLDCCRPLEHVQQYGITLPEFTCLARCNGLDAQTYFADNTSFEQFERDIIESSRSTDQFIAVSYSRASLGQTGSGHFSPIGGYSAMNGGMVLVLDVARFKYPSYWVPIRKLFESLIPVDTVTGSPRGYVVLKRRAPKNPISSSLFRLNLEKSNWIPVFEILKKQAKAAESLEELMSLICVALQNSPIVSREGELSAAASQDPPYPAQQFSPDSPPDTSIETRYIVNLDELCSQLATTSRIYQLLSNQKDRPEWAIFFLALFTFRPFFVQLSEDIRIQLDREIGRDLTCATIAGEVDEIRRQMGGLNTCCNEETGNCNTRCDSGRESC